MKWNVTIDCRLECFLIQNITRPPLKKNTTDNGKVLFDGLFFVPLLFFIRKKIRTVLFINISHRHSKCVNKTETLMWGTNLEKHSYTYGISGHQLNKCSCHFKSLFTSPPHIMCYFIFRFSNCLSINFILKHMMRAMRISWCLFFGPLCIMRSFVWLKHTFSQKLSIIYLIVWYVIHLRWHVCVCFYAYLIFLLVNENKTKKKKNRSQANDK